MRFALISDTHIGGRFDEVMFNRGMEIACNINADYLIHLGDLTNDGTLAQYEIAKLYLDKVKFDKPFLLIPGNHDVKNVGNLLWEEMIGERFYVHEDSREKVKILALDSSMPDLDPGQMGSKGINRIYEEFQDVPEFWLKVILFHHQTLPIPYTGRERSAIYDAGDAVRAILDNNIHLVLNGHRHISNTFKMSDGAMQSWIINCGTLSCKKTRYREEYSLTIVDVDRETNNVRIRVVLLNQEPIRDKISYSGKFQELILPSKKEKLGSIVQIGNTDISDECLNVEVYNKGLNYINNLDCDLVVHCGDVTSSSHYHEFELAKALLEQIEKPKLIVPGGNDAYPLGFELFPEMIGDMNPTFENEVMKVLGFNSCIIDDKTGRIGRGNAQIIKNELVNPSKLGIVAFHHTIVPLPRSKHDAELMDAGDVLATIVENRLNLVLTGAKNRAGCWQINDTVFSNNGTLSSINITTKLGNSFNIIDIYKTKIGKFYEIDEYIIERDERRKIGLFHISDIGRPIKVPPRINYSKIIDEARTL
ncbi:MAG: metallophosphoesterase [Candidatus Heimdallarchaeota archaeon]|nr:metallophosphoesterase [Candidatus Heimdallarchaeota archaeon]